MGKGHPCKPHKNLLTYRLSFGRTFGSSSLMIRSLLVSISDAGRFEIRWFWACPSPEEGNKVKQIHLEILHEGEH
jgi:hypothetical protein